MNNPQIDLFLNMEMARQRKGTMFRDSGSDHICGNMNDYLNQLDKRI